MPERSCRSGLWKDSRTKVQVNIFIIYSLGMLTFTDVVEILN